MDTLNIDQIIHLREEAIQKLLDQRNQMLAELESIKARVSEIEDQLQKLGHQLLVSPHQVRRTKSKGKLYEYQEGSGFILLETGEVIGPGRDTSEALEAIKEWCAKVGKVYYPTQWRRVIDPDYGKR